MYHYSVCSGPQTVKLDPILTARCKNNDDGTDQPLAGEKKIISGIARGDQQLQLGDHSCKGFGNEM